MRLFLLPICRSLAAGALGFCSANPGFAADDTVPSPPPVMLAETYHLGDPIDLPAYRISEKYDGVRAWWTGRELLTRSGRSINAPAWFTAGWPKQVLDGELWGGRGRFEETSGIARQDQASDEQWRSLRYRVFDLPEQAGDFDQRLRALEPAIRGISSWIEAVPQEAATTEIDLRNRLDAIVAAGGEGLMLHRGDSLYGAGRSRDLLKLKPYDDAEAIVVAHLPGQGKYQGLTGSLLVARPDGLRFAVGSGLSDEQRRHPPPIGGTITYAYTGLTATGTPRFARFLRMRPPP